MHVQCCTEKGIVLASSVTAGFACPYEEWMTDKYL